MDKFRFQFKSGFGLHARPAGMLVKTAGGFESNITVIKEEDGNRASAKGLFALLGLKIEGGDSVIVEAEGPDEKEAIEVISNLFKNDFKLSDKSALGAETLENNLSKSDINNKCDSNEK